MVGSRNRPGPHVCEERHQFVNLRRREEPIWPPRRDVGERRLIEQGCLHERTQVVLIRQAQGRIVLVEPMHHYLQPAPGVEAGRSRIGIRQCLRLARLVVQVGPFGFEEGEVAHALSFRGAW